MWSLSKDICERRSSTGGGLLAFMGSGFVQIFGQVVAMTVKTLTCSNTNLVASRHIKREKASLPFESASLKNALHEFGYF